MISSIQLLGVAFGLMILYLTYLSFKKKEFNIADLAVWGSVGVVFLLIVIFPQTIDVVLETFHIQGAMWFLTIVGFMFLFVLVFQLYKKVKGNQKKLEKLVKEIALDRTK